MYGRGTENQKRLTFRDAPGVDVSKNAAHPCIMHAAAVGLNYSRLSVEWRALRQLNSTLARALSSHTFNNESPCRPINNLCPSVANQPSQKPSRPADRVVVIFECVRRVHCDALCVSSVCTELALSVIYGRHNNKYIRRRRRACERH